MRIVEITTTDNGKIITASREATREDIPHIEYLDCDGIIIPIIQKGGENEEND